MIWIVFHPMVCIWLHLFILPFIFHTISFPIPFQKVEIQIAAATVSSGKVVFWMKKVCMNVLCIVRILETVQDFLIKLDIKPLMHILKISIFSLNNHLVRLTKIMNNLVKDLKILSFKVIFKCLKYLIRRPNYINEIFWKLWFLKYFIY